MKKTMNTQFIAYPDYTFCQSKKNSYSDFNDCKTSKIRPTNGQSLSNALSTAIESPENSKSI